MRLAGIKGKIEDASSLALVFFLQSLDEQVYDLTDHSYKAPSLNTFTRTLELQSLARSNFKSGIGKEALRPFVSELKWSVSRDAALSAELRALCQVHVESASESLTEPDRIARSLAGLRISLGNYLDLVKGKIRDLIKCAPEKRADLYQLASSFIVQSEALGYPRRHTYHTVQGIARRLTDVSVLEIDKILDLLFDEFRGTASHSCTLIIPAEASAYGELLARFGIEVIEGPLRIEGLSVRQQNFEEIRKDHQRFALIPGIKAPSVVMAAQIAANRFSSFSSIVRSVNHKFNATKEHLILVEREGGNRFLVRDDQDPIQCWSPSSSKGEEYMLLLAEAVHGKHLLEESKRRLEKAVKYHSSALDTTSIPHKLTSLWAGLEGLLSTPRKGMSRIEFFAESILPCLILAYPEYLLRSLMERLYKVQGVQFEIENMLVGGKSGDKFADFARFAICKEYDDKREFIVDLIGDKNPLLKYRCFEVWRKLRGAKAIVATLQSHRAKVKWHIERIYSMRNSIMHDASALPYLSTLVENIHGYMDILVESIAKISVSAEEAISIESALLYMASWEKYRMDRLTKIGDVSVDEINIQDLVFGKSLGMNSHL